MPKVSRVARKTAPGDAKPVEEREGGYTCTRCGKTFRRQKGNFSASQSSLFKGNNGYLPVCNNCLDMLYSHYKEVLGSSDQALRRICMKFDIYWSEDIYKMLSKINTSASRVRSYISKTYLIRFTGKTYDDTLDEEHSGGRILNVADLEDNEDIAPDEAFAVDADTVRFWGGGLGEDFYQDLQQRYERWTGSLPKPLTPAQEALYKQICIQEVSINRNIVAGKSIEQGQNVLNNLLGSLNEKPKQQTESSADVDGTPLGVWIRRWEEDRPVPEYEADDADRPSLIKYITTWFYGHAAKALGLSNMYSQVYEDEMARYRVTKPEFEGEEDDLVISDMVGGADDS